MSPFEPVAQSAVELAKAKGVPFETRILAGHPVQRIAELVENDDFDLLVVGYSGHSALYERLVGSTADRLVSLARCTVMVVR